jgi:CRISPR-associated protein Cas1
VQPDDAQESVLSLADVALVMVGLRTRIGASVLQQLATFDAVVLICDWKGVPIAGMYGWSDHTRVGARQNAQVLMSVPRRKNAWGQVVRAKIAGQAANLRYLGHSEWRRLERMASQVRSGDPTNMEGTAARFYWPSIFEGSGFSRLPQSGFGRNAMLDYGYAVLRGFGVRAVLSAGLAAAIGLFHTNRSNAFNLVDDLIEPFRPAVDWVVATMPTESCVDDPKVRHELVGSCAQPFGGDGLSVAATLNDLAQQFGRYAENQIDRLRVPAWSGPRRSADDEELTAW